MLKHETYLKKMLNDKNPRVSFAQKEYVNYCKNKHDDK